MFFHRAAVLLLFVSSLPFTIALNPQLSKEEINLYTWSRDSYFLGFGPHIHGADYFSHWTHLAPAHPTLEQDALGHAHLSGNGPFYVAQSLKRDKLLVATKVSGMSPLGIKWGLRHNVNGQVVTQDAQLLWRVDKNGPKLLRLGLWPPGSEPPQRSTMQDVIRRLQPRPI